MDRVELPNALRTGPAGVGWLAAATAAALGLGSVVPLTGPAGWAVGTGFAVRSRLATDAEALALASRALRLGVALLGLQIGVAELVAIGRTGLALALGTAALTLAGTLFVGRRLGVDRDLSLLIAGGSSICGASAIVALDSVIESRREDVAYAIAVVSLLGTLAMVALPVVAISVLGLDEDRAGLWAGASIHEVAQATGAGALISAQALQLATLVKLGRVALLAPLVAAVAIQRDASGARHLATSGRRVGLAPPPFLLAFLALALLASLLSLPPPVLDAAMQASAVLLACGLVGLGAQLDISALRRAGGRPLTLGVVAAVMAATVSLAMLLVLPQ